MKLPKIDRHHITINRDGLHGKLFLDKLIGSGKKIGEFLSRVDLINILNHWAGESLVFPIGAFAGVFEEKNYKNRYLSKPINSKGKTFSGVFLNKSYIQKGMELHLCLLLPWTILIKELRRQQSDSFSHTFYHQDSKGRTKLEDFAATCFTTLAVGEFSRLGQKHVIAKQVHDYNNLTPIMKDRLIQIYMEIKSIFLAMEVGLISHYKNKKEGILWLIKLTNSRLQKLGLLDEKSLDSSEELIWLSTSHPLTMPVKDIDEIEI